MCIRDSFGIWKSNDAGSTWTKIPVFIDGTTSLYQPMDLEISPSTNKLWISTTRNFDGLGAGVILVSNDDFTSFIKKYTVQDGLRTELEIAKNGDVYVLADVNNSAAPVTIIKSTNEFASTPTTITLPNDADSGIPASDFTRGQSFYDLLIESDPNNSNTIFVGGIDLFKSINGAVDSNSNNPWNQISKWSNNNDLATLNVSWVHADQHFITFANTDSTKKLFGNDGGISYSKTKQDGTEEITTRNNDFNTSQIYTIGVAPSEMFKIPSQIGGRTNVAFTSASLAIDENDDVVAGGLQDNGSQIIADATNSTSFSVRHQGGDGAATMFSQDPTKRYLISNYVYDNAVVAYNFDITDIWGNARGFYINSSNESHGNFINEQALDSKKGIFWTSVSMDLSRMQGDITERPSICSKRS